MKPNKIKRKYSNPSLMGAIRILLFLSIICLSCNEDEWLREIPKDFLAPEIAFVTYDDFFSANTTLYHRYMEGFWNSSGSTDFPYQGFRGTELVYGVSRAALMNYTGTFVRPESELPYVQMWKPAYHLIYDANVVIGRSDGPYSELSEQEKLKIKAEAKFFRGLAYKMLANKYGGVPIVLEETTEPKRDYVRASREEVYEQCILDLKFAAENLLGIDEVDNSRVNNLVAYHVLSEIYISLEQWQDAIDAATMVIDHPGMALMTERFGVDTDPEKVRFPVPFNDTVYGGDVYWDLFRPGNQNRKDGNTEALWVGQYAVDVPGGAGGGAVLERQVAPRTTHFAVINEDGRAVPIVPHPNTYITGRGIGGLRPTNYFLWDIWHKSGYNLDIRNSKYNIIRDVPVMNPASEHFGKWVFKDSVPARLNSEVDTTRNWYPIIAKSVSTGRHPEFLFHSDQTVPGSLTSQARLTYRDNYIYRLAETYLLRAEAYLGNNNLIDAAADINVVRRRANAPEVTPSEVDIDYILDERLRELHFEEFYILTLMRLGMLVERTNKYNPLLGYGDHQNLYPIPVSEIEKNTGAKLEQNPGY